VKIFFSAGEASGDALGSSLIEALRKKEPQIEAFGMGGPRMVAAGLRALRGASELNVVGLFEVLAHLPRLYRLLWDLQERGVKERPDVAVLIDVPDFNVRLARAFVRAKIPVVFYVGPSVWAWRSGRVERFKRLARRMLVLFPFEVEIWRSAGVDVRCVGHPFIDEIPEPSSRALAVPKRVALLPGSRRSEIRRLLPIMISAAAELVRRGLAERFVLPVAPTIDASELEAEIARSPIAERIELVRSVDAAPRRAAIAQSAAAIVASGTATLETALIGTPQVIVYRLSPLTWIIGKLLMKVKHLGLPNLIVGSSVVPELLQDDLQSEALAERAAEILSAPEDQERALVGLRARLGDRGAADRAADAVLELLRGPAA
jgi:lipid-A-disaccharide synthase